MLSFFVFFVLAALHDLTACYWYDLRDSGRDLKAALLAMALEAMQWLPVWFALQQDDISIAIAAVAGSGVGTWAGLKRGKRFFPSKLP